MPTRESEVLSRLPVLLEQGNFPEWDAYLRRVYGEADPPVYPVDLGRLSWLYYDDLPIILAPVQRAPRIPLGHRAASRHRRKSRTAKYIL